MHPHAILPIRFNGRAVRNEIAFNVFWFFILYLISFIVGEVVLAAPDLDLLSALGGAATSPGNIGPAFGTLGPVNNFGALPALAKW